MSSPTILSALLLSASVVGSLGTPLKVTLDYGTYVGYADITSGFNIWKRQVNPATLNRGVLYRFDVDIRVTNQTQASATPPLRRDGKLQSGPLVTPRTQSKPSLILPSVHNP